MFNLAPICEEINVIYSQYYELFISHSNVVLNKIQRGTE